MSSTQVFQHCTHIHPLTKVDGFGDFRCNGCKTYGFGKTYRCYPCDYDLHEYCATCPPTLLSFLHPQHKLQLVIHGPAGHMCDFCLGPVDGFYYRCQACDFDVHPLCTQKPQLMSFMPHPAHPLELSQCGTSNTCMVCQGPIFSWRYKCGPCMLDVHLECVKLSAPAVTGSQQDLHTTSGQYLKPCHDECRHNLSDTNKGQGQVRGPSKRKRVFRFLKHLTVHVVTHIIADM